MIGHNGSVDRVVTTRVPVTHRVVERHFHDPAARHRRPVGVVLEQVLVAMATLGRRPRNRVVLGEIDADDVSATDRDAIPRV